MVLTARQLQIVRDALLTFRNYGGRRHDRRQSWESVVDRLAEYTSYNFENDRDFQRKNDGESLRRFAGNKTQSLSKDLMTNLIELLCHKEIRILDLDNLFRMEIDLTLFMKLRDYISSEQILKSDILTENRKSSFAGISFADEKLSEQILPSYNIKCPYAALHIYVELSDLLFQDKSVAGLRLIEIILTCPFTYNGINGSLTGQIKKIYHGVAILKNSNNFLALVTEGGRSKGSSFEVTLNDHVNNESNCEGIISSSEFAPINIDSDDRCNGIFLGSVSEFINSGRFENALINNSRSGVINRVGSCYLTEKYLDDINNVSSSFILSDAVLGKRFRHRGNAVDDWHNNFTSIFAFVVYMEGLSYQLLRALLSNDLTEFDGFLAEGASLHVHDPASGKTALHIIAGHGWRDGLRLALAFPERCNFTARDKAGKLASYYARVDGMDEAMARLLSFYEWKAGAGLRKTDDRPRPVSWAKPSP